MPFSIYSTAFNIIDAQFDVGLNLKNWFNYADEVVIATIKNNKDDTVVELLKWRGHYKDKLKIVITDIDLKNPLSDGQMKNEAMQNCTHNYVIQQDLDELICGKKEDWEQVFVELEKLNKKFGIMALMMPVLNIWGDINHYSDINEKWYPSFKKGLKRGVVNFAKKNDGYIDITKSDSCEILLENGNLPNWGRIYQNCKEENYLDFFKQGSPFICHFGYLDLKRRAEIINPIWKPVWEARAGHAVQVPLELKDLKKEAKPHGLDLSSFFN